MVLGEPPSTAAGGWGFFMLAILYDSRNRLLCNGNPFFFVRWWPEAIWTDKYIAFEYNIRIFG